nr:PREDICTED: tumor necrosis factor receptor superfamily member 10B isoform X1 [Anolis carolinensis]|eukprot:XP_016848761.1 PREDICTED: tumor necrosis factor receptor superfamily member 10B isoform X1 [Anolis carolinensis]
MCRAGTYVEEACTIPHTLGRCSPCTNGEDYTEHESGLNQCFPCEKCKPGYVMVKACTATSNTKCQCPEGYYCPPGCEECVKCRKRCPKGEVQVKSCSSTTDMECSPSSTGTTDSAHPMGIIITVVFSVIGIGIVIMIAILFKFRKRNSLSTLERVKESKSLISVNSDAPNTNPEMPGLRNKGSQNEESSNLMVGSTSEGSDPRKAPSAPMLQQSENPAFPSVPPNIPKKPVVKLIDGYSKTELNRIYFNLRNMVLLHDWSELMRKCGLTNNDIETLKFDHPRDINEAHYQMLLTLQNRKGIDGALCKLLDGLWELKLMSIYENVTNELIHHKIITRETRD